MGSCYGLNDIESKLLKRVCPGGRILTLKRQQITRQQPLIITEFGDIAFEKRDCKQNGGPDGWGYSRASMAEQFVERYRTLLDYMRNMPALAGPCYSQFTGT